MSIVVALYLEFQNNWAMDQILAMRVFNRVADRGSFAQAADELDIAGGRERPRRSPRETLGARLRKSHDATRQPHGRRQRVPAAQPAHPRGTERRRGLAARRALEAAGPVARRSIAHRARRYLLLPALPDFTRRYPLIELTSG
jgi:hypothetical protein